MFSSWPFWLMTNIDIASMKPATSPSRQVKRLSAAFEGRALAFPSCDSGNVVALAARGAPITVGATELRERAADLQRDTGLDLRPTVTRLEHSGALPGGILAL